MIPHARRLALFSLCLCALAVHADDERAAGDGAFALGQITITAARLQPGVIGDPTVTNDATWAFNLDTLDRAVALIPGVTGNFDANGRRNEHDILVRGYGRWQVPLSIDGIRVYLPADNRLDFSRFLTQDLAEIQVQKGYASVIDGPGGLGGAINLVTRKPVKPFEVDARVALSAARDGDTDSSGAALSIGTRQPQYYLQASGSYLDRDHWTLPGGFTPTTIEDGGDRNGSDNRDYRVNLKAGHTPNATDEYSLSYTSQSGRKGAPLNVYNDPPVPPNSYWRWPWWDIESLYWLSSTQLGETAWLKTRLFYNTFDNALDAFDDASYTTQSNNGRFRSIYADEGYGGSVEIGGRLAGRHALRMAVHYRRDEHTEYNINRPTHPTLRSIEPKQGTLEETWSLALEDTIAATDTLDVVFGVSYDRNDIDKAQEYNATSGVFDYPVGGSHAFNGQAMLRWRYAPGRELAASVSDRTRFPTLFERYSTRFGTALPNPDLDPERGVNYELRWNADLDGGAHLYAALFYNDVLDMIQTVVADPGPPQLTQTHNVGDGEYYGAELAADAQLNASLRVGGHYTHMQRRIRDPLQPGLRAVGTPENQALLFLAWQPWPAFTIMPSIEYADDRWSDLTGGAYTRTGQYTLVNLQIEYRMRSGWQAAVGGRNLTDEEYELAWGFPEPGRSWYAKLRYVLP